MEIDDRTDVLERRTLAQGKTPEEWAVEVSQPIAGVWRTMFYVGSQGFTLANTQDKDEAEEHCMFIGRMFVRALENIGVKNQGDDKWMGS
jgi:hypothetical protein